MARATKQLTIDLPSVESGLLGDVDVTEEHGEVFTLRWVVELILDLAGYTADRDLAATVAVEPACGAGAFLGPWPSGLSSRPGRHGRTLSDAAGSVQAFDLRATNVDLARTATVANLLGLGVGRAAANRLARGWVARGDFLLADHDLESADFVLGNPPYIRLESGRPSPWISSRVIGVVISHR